MFSSRDLESERRRNSLAEADSLKALKLVEGPIDLPAQMSLIADEAVQDVLRRNQGRDIFVFLSLCCP